MNNLIKFFLLFLIAFTAKAQVNKPMLLETENTALVLNVGANGRIYQTYFGEKLTNYTELQPGRKEAYVSAGTDNVFEPAIRVVHNDGNPSLELKYLNHTLNTKDNISILRINCSDSVYPVNITMIITAYKKENVFKTAIEISHREKEPLIISNIASSMLRLSASKYWLTHFHGDWAKEMQMEETQLTSGIKIIDSKTGTRPHMFQAPLFMLSLNQNASEYTGEVIAGTLAWPGNFRFSFELENDNSLRLITGINPYASDYRLQPTQKFTTPEFVFTYSNKGKFATSYNFQQWARKYGIHKGEEGRSVVMNNWETTHSQFTEPQLIKLIEKSGKMGADIFLLDAGWYSNPNYQDGPKVGLGDWKVNKSKLPGGIKSLIDESKKNKMKFGIWIESEMVNPKSQLYKQHPDWVLRLPNREQDTGKTKYVLDLANPKVQDHVFGVVDSLMIQNPGLAYFKWDSNMEITNAYSTYLGNSQSNLYIDYSFGLMKAMQRIQDKYPNLPMMLCSSGGYRIDYGALKYFTEFWPSDNTDPIERIYLHYAYSFFYPALALSSHVTAWGKQSLKFRTDVAMLGKLGYDIDLEAFSTDDFAFSQSAVKIYKNISNTIWKGIQYRLVSPYEGNRAAFQYVAGDKSESIVLSYTMNARFREMYSKVKLQGLVADKKYIVSEINLYPLTASKFKFHNKEYSGEYLMKIGLDISSQEPLTSCVFQLKAL